MAKSIAVVGAGFNGMCTAYMLSKKGFAVTLIDAGPVIGGVMASREVGDYIYDLGCHLMDNAYGEHADLVREILDDEIVPHQTVYASVVNGKITKGMENPNLSVLGEEIGSKIVSEMLDIENNNKKQKPKNMKDVVEARFGPTATKYLDKYISKKSQAGFDKLSASIFSNMVPDRIHCVDEEKARLLKENPALDAKIAASSMEDPLTPYRDVAEVGEGLNYRQFYPKNRGMLGFCEALKDKVIANGGVVLTSTICEAISQSDDSCSLKLKNHSTQETSELTTDMLFWASEIGILSNLLGGSKELSNFHHKVPMILYYFNLPADEINEFSYITNYDDNCLTFRVSAPSNYGSGTAPDGMGYICVEVTTTMGSEIWNESEEFSQTIWQEVLDMGFISPKAKISTPYIIKTPVSFLLKATGFTKEFAEFKEFSKDMKNIYYPDSAIISKSGIHDDVSAVLKRMVD